MRHRLVLAATTMAVLASLGFGQSRSRLNPVIARLEQKKPAFGIYAPRNPRAPRGASGTVEGARPKTPAQLAADALGYAGADYVFDGSMEGDFDRAFPAFGEFVQGMVAGSAAATGAPVRRHPLIVKMHEIAPDPAKAAAHIAQQLALGVSGVVFVKVESPDEVRAGLAAMRFRSMGGTRPDDVGGAPAYWGVSEAEYRRRAGVWPLDPDGELINFTIVESREGLARVREIAAVRGIGVLFPGAGTLRGVFTTTSATGERVFDEKGWEAAIQQVLSACKEFGVPCGYPANAGDIEMRMQQGFSVFIVPWGEQGFRAVDIGRRAAGRGDVGQR